MHKCPAMQYAHWTELWGYIAENEARTKPIQPDSGRETFFYKEQLAYVSPGVPSAARFQRPQQNNEPNNEISAPTPLVHLSWWIA